MVRRPARTVVTLLAVAAGSVGLAACGDDDQTAQPARTSSAMWRPDADPIDTSGLIYASGSTVHLDDGSTIDTGQPIDSYVVAGDSVYFTGDEVVDDVEGAGIGARPLYAADRDGSVRMVADGVESPLASPDGRYLVFLDAVSSDERDRFGTIQVQTVVVDLREGQEVARTSEGMGDPGEDDLTDLYGESEIRVLQVTDETAYVDAVGDYAFDLATGDAEELGDDGTPPVDRLTSPDGRWTIVDTESLRDRLVSSDGREVTPQTGTPRWTLDHWTGDGRAVGFAVDGPGRGSTSDPRDSSALMTCEVPSGRCKTLPETTGTTIRLPNGQTEYESADLPDGR